jgi:hypothetical protein
LEAEITELRLWKNNVDNVNDIKESYRTPLEIVSEKKK